MAALLPVRPPLRCAAIAIGPAHVARRAGLPALVALRRAPLDEANIHRAITAAPRVALHVKLDALSLTQILKRGALHRSSVEEQIILVTFGTNKAEPTIGHQLLNY